ncbi:MAG: SCP2 sterol-binding domain-containing protein [Thermoplasmatales archaeon]|nr:MAG: SCP2 sterol-binding domain-containing protein [Thermoplasmatales archaeon]
MVKFLSEEWIDIGKKYIIEKLDPQKDLKSITTSLLGVVEHIPPDDITMNFYLELEDGNLKDFIVNTGDTFEEKKAAYEIRGNYGTYKSVLKGEMSLGIAVLKNRLKVKGSKMQALKLIKPLDGVIVSLQKITDEFE